MKVRDSAPQYQYHVPVLTLGAVEFVTETHVWLTDIDERNGSMMWDLHGQPTAVHYARPNPDRPPLILCSRRTTSFDERVPQPLYPLRTRSDITNGLQNAVYRLTSKQYPGPKNAENSCHLDVFLMSELAFYSAHSANVPDDVSALPEPIQRILQTLVCLGHFRDHDILNQDVARNDYRTYELSNITHEERHAITIARRGTCDYVWHGVLLATLTQHAGRAEYVQEERMLRRTVTHECSGVNCFDESKEEELLNVHVPMSRQWYPFSDKTASTLLGKEGLGIDGPSYGIDHGSFQSMLMSLLHRPIGESTLCTKCQIETRTTTKSASGIRFPRSLELDEGHTSRHLPLRTEIEARLNLGSVKYDLISITLQNEGHFVVIVKFGASWYEYDDLRRNPLEGETHNLPTLTSLGGHEEVHQRLAHLKDSRAALCPRAWRYTLDPTSVPVGLVPRWDTNIDVSAYNQKGWNEPLMHDDTIQLNKKV